LGNLSFMRHQSETEDNASILRAMAAHEAEQVNRRLSWFGTLQGLLFAALAFTWDKSSKLTIIISGLGIFVAAMVSMGIIAATLAMERIRKMWEKKKPQGYDGPDIFGFYPTPRWRFTIFTSPENLLPLGFIVAWILIALLK
jgi:hypothetical protein